MNHGKHIKILGRGASALLGDPENISQLLRDVVAVAGMRPLSEPQIHDVELDIKKLGAEPFEDEGGVTGIVVLSTSHCAIHTWPLRHYFCFDLFSCRDFETAAVVKSLTRAIGGFHLEVRDLSSALEYPGDD